MLNQQTDLKLKVRGNHLPPPFNATYFSRDLMDSFNDGFNSTFRTYVQTGIIMMVCIFVHLGLTLVPTPLECYVPLD